MPVNDLTFNDLSTVLVSLHAQATGSEAATPVDSSQFVTVGQNILKAGYDPVCKAISQVLAKTVFANRPYNAKFKSLMLNNQSFGAWSRKISLIDRDMQQDSRYLLEDDTSIDMYKVRKPKAYQENFYGANTYSRSVTIFKDQLDTAFNSPADFQGFLAFIFQNAGDIIEQTHEEVARATLANLICGTIDAANTNQVVHLLTEYNAATGLTLTEQDINKPENFPAFIKWAYARVESVSKLLEERSNLYHLNPEIGKINRHTPQRAQKVYMSTMKQNEITARVLADVYHDNYLKNAKVETVNYWQAIQNPEKIIAKPSYLDVANGGVKTASDNVTVENLFGVIFDEQAAGINIFNQWTMATPFNAAGGYYNQWWHWTEQYYNSFTENCVVFLLD